MTFASSPGPVVAVGGVVVHDDALLMIRRGAEPDKGRWSIPGGRVERGEALRGAVERELREETGLRVVCGSLLGWAERISDDFHYVILDFEASLVGDRRPVAGGDALDAAWTPLAMVPTRDLAGGLWEFLRDHGVVRPAQPTER